MLSNMQLTRLYALNTNNIYNFHYILLYSILYIHFHIQIRRESYIRSISPSKLGNENCQ